MFGIACYLAVAMTAAVALFLAAEWIREPRTRAPEHPGRTALLGGLLWPLVLIGLAQCALVVAIHNRWGVSRRPVPHIPVGSSAP